MGDNATISLLRSAIMSNVSCCYPPDHPLSPWMSPVPHISHGCHCWIASSTFCGLVHILKHVWALAFWNLFPLLFHVYSPIYCVLIIISVLCDLSTMIRRDGVSSDWASHPSIFPGHPQHPVIIHTPATHLRPQFLWINTFSSSKSKREWIVLLEINSETEDRCQEVCIRNWDGP